MRPRNETSGVASQDQIANRQPATITNTGYPTPIGVAPGSPLVPTAQGQNTAAGAVVNLGGSPARRWGSFAFGRNAFGRTGGPAKRRKSSRSSSASSRSSSRRSTRKVKTTRGRKARLVKGSAAAKRYMAKIRRMRRK